MTNRLVLFLFLVGSQLLPAEVTSRIIGDGFKLPVWASAPKGENNLLWVVEKKGTIRILNRKTGKKQLFLDITPRVGSRGNEEGLLGLAFSKDYLRTGRFYVYLTSPKMMTEVIRFTAHGKEKHQCSPSTAEVLITFKQPYRNHNGGWIGFGPDNFLYIGTGDGGSANDPKNNSQNLDSYLGKLLRIDVSPEKGYRIPADNPFKNNAKAKPEIYAYGLRNPWRCSWDRKTKDFYIGDVGQNAWEEIDYMPADQGKGANYGWRLREGLRATPKKGTGGPKPKGAIDPIYVYKHGSGPREGVSITGGYVYRGPIKSLHGKYFFADYANSRIWSFTTKHGKMTQFEDWTERLQSPKGKIRSISSFGEDNDGNLLIISYKGIIYEMTEK
jgi:glucose/arabinose dehydrogenase